MFNNVGNKYILYFSVLVDSVFETEDIALMQKTLH